MLLALPAPILAQTWAEQAQLVAGNPAAGEQFGFSVSLSGDTVVVGVPSDDTPGVSNAGSAYVFVRTGTTWTQQAQLIANDAMAPNLLASDQFGHSVSLSGDTVVIGARGDDAAAVNSGSAYVFVRAGTTWTQQAKLIASDGGQGHFAGFAVAVNDETAIVGAPNASSAYVFVRSGTTWTQQAKLTATGLGYSVALSGDTAVIGSGGRAYVFGRSGTTWMQQAELLPNGSALSGFFGGSVAVSGQTAVVGAPLETTAAGLSAGSAYVFIGDGTNWTQEARLLAADASSDDGFGHSVSVSGNTVVVGADVDDTAGGVNAGSAYVFVRDGGAWIQQARVVAQDVSGGLFGYSVSVDGETIAVGAHAYEHAGLSSAGKAYIFVRQPVVIPTEPIPTLSEWALLALCGLLAGVALIRLSPQRRRT